MKEIPQQSAPRAPLRRTKDPGRLIPLLLVAPALAIFALLFVVPLINLFFMSLSPPESFEVVLEEASVGNYTKFLTDSFYLGILGKTIKIAFITTLVCLLVGYPLAYYIDRSSGTKRAYLILLILSPLLVNVLVRSYGWIVVLGPNGVVNWVLKTFGITDQSVSLLYTEPTIVIGLTQVFLAYMVMTLAAVLQNIDRSLLLAAQNLGANRFQAFLKVTLPLSLPGIVAGSVLVFALSSSAFVTPALLGGATNKVMSYLVYQQALSVLNWPLAGAVAFILMFSVGILVFVFVKTIESRKYGVIFR